MEEKEVFESLFEKAEAYAKTNAELLKLKAIDKSADAASTLASKIIVFVVVIFVLTILNIGLSLWIGELTGKLYYGFFIVAGFYILVGLILHFGRNQLLKNPINNSIISHLVKDKKL